MTLWDLVALQRRGTALLLRMSLLGDAEGSSFPDASGALVEGESSTGHIYAAKAHATSSPPPPVDSLYDKWRTRFEEDWPAIPDNPDQAAIDWCYERAEALVEHAEADVDRFLGTLRPPEEKWSVEDGGGHNGRAKDRAILIEGVGQSAIRVAIRQKCPVQYVRRLRVAHSRDAATGR